MLLIDIQNSLKIGLTLPDKKVLKYYLGRDLSFEEGFKVQFSTFSEIVLKIGKFQPGVAFKSVACKKKRVNNRRLYSRAVPLDRHS